PCKKFFANSLVTKSVVANYYFLPMVVFLIVLCLIAVQNNLKIKYCL
ncbi:hypothetical protein D1BOALGB6SA_906, partial [Olavius sp. associated proteobacterium Delta 1]